MRLALDVMGSDACPGPDVAGGLMAARDFGYDILLVGDKAAIERELMQHPRLSNIEVIHADQAVTMEDKPGIVGKSKPHSSMHVGMNLVRDGRADAFVTAGNTGAAHAIATLHTLRRIRGVRRPALSGVFPLGDGAIIILDIGANADSKAEWLAQFALMGSIYAERVLHKPNPRVALLSNGEEETKGNQLTHLSAPLISALNLNFVGNVEPKEIVGGHVDVIICDGFVGNIFLKTFEASGAFLSSLIRDELKRNVFTLLGGLLARPAFRRARSRTDTSEIGGAPLLGVNGVVIIGHGRSDARAIRNAIHQAAAAARNGVIPAIQMGMQELEDTVSD